MNKFTARLNASGNGIRAERSAIVAKQTESAQTKYITRLEDELLSLEDKRMKLEDINVDSEMTTKVVPDAFNPENWISQLNSIEMDIVNKEVEIEIAKRVQTRWFKEEAVIEAA